MKININMTEYNERNKTFAYRSVATSCTCGQCTPDSITINNPDTGASKLLQRGYCTSNVVRYSDSNGEYTLMFIVGDKYNDTPTSRDLIERTMA